MSDSHDDKRHKAPIIGQPHPVDDEAAREITQMILETQGSNRQLTIPPEDLDQQATTSLIPEAARVIAASHVRDILNKFNRDYLYGLGRFDEYAHGLLLKWGDGYSRKHIWVMVEADNLVFQTSHERSCGQPQCQGGRHVYGPDEWKQVRVVNHELAEQFNRPVYERSDD